MARARTHTISIVIGGAAVALVPSATAAATLDTVIGRLHDIIVMLIPVVLALAVLGFFWGLMKYLFGAGDSDKRGGGIRIMLMGVIVLFLMMSLWGVVGLLQQTFGLDDSQPVIPVQR